MVGGSIRDAVFEILHWLNPSGCDVALGSNKPLAEMSITDLPLR